MPDLTKIATCSYCGTRTVLRLVGAVRHELSCRACGALLHNMKPLPVAASTTTPNYRPAASRLLPAQPKKKPRRRPKRRLTALVWDIFDEIEDIFD